MALNWILGKYVTIVKGGEDVGSCLVVNGADFSEQLRKYIYMNIPKCGLSIKTHKVIHGSS
jgi:hypothetical protein